MVCSGYLEIEPAADTRPGHAIPIDGSAPHGRPDAQHLLSERLRCRKNRTTSLSNSSERTKDVDQSDHRCDLSVQPPRYVRSRELFVQRKSVYRNGSIQR